MMVTLVALGLISLIWGVMGLAMVVAPSSWNGWVRRSFLDPLRRFILIQGLMLAGLVLILGATGHQGRWLWVAVGALAVAKALALLGLSDSGREAWLAACERAPVPAHRLAGVVIVALATLLAIDTLRGSQ